MSESVIKIEGLWKQYRFGQISSGYLFRDVQSWIARLRGKEDPNAKIISGQPLDYARGPQSTNSGQIKKEVSRGPSSRPGGIGNQDAEKRKDQQFQNESEDSAVISSNLQCFDKTQHKATIANQQPEDRFWALRDINLDIKQGEILGIIGRNGAGKSTLLKILSRVTAPTKGTIKVKGRIGSLLEVGTGFHPELSGRENIFLNGAILGMRKREIEKKFDEIVAFAEIERFIDTPVKRYSSGMYVRLAFAVAAHLDPEILIVDEVLAVGDIEFQKKCIGKMGDVSKNDGRTVLLVSHNMEAVNRLCQRGVLLRSGEVIDNGDAETVISKYLTHDLKIAADRKWPPEPADENRVAVFREAFVHTEEHEIRNVFDITKKIGITMIYEIVKDGTILMQGANIYNNFGTMVFGSHDVEMGKRNEPRKRGMYKSTVWIPGNFLAEGVFKVSIDLFRVIPEIIVFQSEADALSFTVVDYCRGDSAKGQCGGHFLGIVRPVLQWETEPVEEKTSRF
jgi:lipopolysaccharide transport system ATP-binding protein